MKPIPSTLETRRRDVIKKCADGVAHPDPRWRASVFPRFRAVVNLGSDPSAEEIIAAQMATGTWWSDLSRTKTCDACGRDVERVVTVGAERDYDSATADLCRECLLDALAALDGAP